MKRIFYRIFILIGLISWLLLSSNFVLAECDGTGKPVGAECHFEDCECATDVCLNGLCVECVSNTDCSDSKQCIDNKCQ